MAIAPGEPAGIGPELLVRLAQEERTAELVAVADPELLKRCARRLGLPLRLREVEPASNPVQQRQPGELAVYPFALTATEVCGRPDPANARYVLDCIEHACRNCLDGTYAAMVTGPVQKSAIRAAGIPFAGHTEWLAHLCAVDVPVMLLTGGGLRVALATVHLPLAEVPSAIVAPRLERVLVVLHRDLQRRFGIARPRIRVCGLNPHAGEDGTLGDTERRVIVPVLERLRVRGLNLEGPVSADTAFIAQNRDGADAVLAMYHDQGLPAIKALDFHGTVNVTLGLPIVRVSVDHGTALDLAGTGRARPDSLSAAVRCATALAEGSS